MGSEMGIRGRYLSGHLHVQHYKRSSEDSGIYEIVTGSLSTPPCQYGVLNYDEDGKFRYHTQALDMKAWAQSTGNTDKNLLNFEDYGKRFLSKVFYNEAQDEFDRLESMKGLTGWERYGMGKDCA